MVAEIRDFFFKYAPCIIVIPMWLAIKIDNSSEELKPIRYYLVLSVVTQAISLVFWCLKINNLLILHIYTTLEFLILFRFYYLVFKESISRLVFILISLAFCLVSLADTLFLENFLAFNTLSRSVESLIFIFLSVMWLLKNLAAEEEPAVAQGSGVNYIISGFFVYFSGSIVLFSFSNYIFRLTRTLLLYIWSVHTLLLVFLYLVITFGLLKFKTK